MFATRRRLVVDYVVPVARGGTHDPDNLVTLCPHLPRPKDAGRASPQTAGFLYARGEYALCP